MNPHTHEAKVARWIPPGSFGAEIGAGASPIPGLDPPPIYIDCFKAFGADPNRADYYGHACDLPFVDHALDYLIASHVLEHVANPVAALAEWHRVIRPGGILYFVVPNRPATFDRPRELTSVEHLLRDYLAGTSACDPTHIDEFAFGIDWSRYEPATAEEEIPGRRALLARGMHEAVARGEDINIHFHTFELTTVRELLDALSIGVVSSVRPQVLAGTPAADGTASPDAGDATAPRLPRFNWEILELVENFPVENPNGILAVLRVSKGWRDRADAEAFRLRTAGRRDALLRPGAMPFAEWAAATPGLGGVQPAAR